MARQNHPTEANMRRLDAARGRMTSLLDDWTMLVVRGAPQARLDAAWARVEAQRHKVEAVAADFNRRFPPA